jgi:hypothetical protein
MFLHHLRQWLSRVRARLSGLLHSQALSTSNLEHESPMAAGTRRRESAISSNPLSSGLASARWLDDTRRMRPRVAPAKEWAPYDRQAQPTRLIRPDSLPGSSPRPPDRTLEISSGTHIPPTPTPRPEFPTMPPAGQQISAPTPRPEFPTMPPGGTADHPDSNESGRRLMALKYLVRLGIYNEGFASTSVPDQYQHSLGMDESSMADSHENLGSDGGAGNRS